MAYDTYISSGTFTGTGNSVFLPFPGGVDWIRVYNQTALAQAAANLAYEFYWQTEMPQGQGIFWTKQGAVANDPVTVGFLAAGLGFSRYDLSMLSPGAPVIETAITNAVQPVVSTGSTAGLAVGTIVRLSNDAGQPNTMGIDFEIDTIVANTSFRVRYALANVPGAAGTGGFYRIIAPNSQVYPLFAPPWRFIVNISQAANAVVTTSVSHNFLVGDNIRFNIPNAWGMTQLNGQIGTITAVTAGTFTVNINTTGYNAFTYAAIAAVPFSWAQAIPMSANTSYIVQNNLYLTPDATNNIATYGMLLPGGAASPGGANADVLYWIAGKNFSV